MPNIGRVGRQVFSKHTARVIVQSKLFEFLHLTSPKQSEVDLDVTWDDYLRKRKIIIDTSKHLIRTKKMKCSIYDPIEVLTQCYRRDVVLRIWICGINPKKSTAPLLKNRMLNFDDERALLSEDSAGEPEDSQDEGEVDEDDPNGIFCFRRQPLPPVLLPQESEPILNIHRTIPTLPGEGLLPIPRSKRGRPRKIPARFVVAPPAMEPQERPSSRRKKSVRFEIPSPPNSPARYSLNNGLKSYKSSCKLPNFNSRSALDLKRRNKELLAKLPPHVKKVSVMANGKRAGSAAAGSSSATAKSSVVAAGSASAAAGSASTDAGIASAAAGIASAAADIASAAAGIVSAAVGSASVAAVSVSAAAGSASAGSGTASAAAGIASSVAGSASVDTDNASAAAKSASADIGNASADTGNASADIGNASVETGNTSLETGYASAAPGSSSDFQRYQIESDMELPHLEPAKPSSGEMPAKSYRNIPELRLKPAAATYERMEVDLNTTTESEPVMSVTGGPVLTGGASSRRKRGRPPKRRYISPPKRTYSPPKTTISVKLPMSQGSNISTVAPVETPGTFLASRAAVPLQAIPSVVIKTSPIQNGVISPMETHDAPPAIPGTSYSESSGNKLQFVKNEIDEDESSSEEDSDFEELPMPDAWNIMCQGQSGSASTPTPEAAATASAKPAAAVNNPIAPIGPTYNIPDGYMAQDEDDEEDLAHNDDKFKLAVYSHFKRLNPGEYRQMQNELRSLSRNEQKWYAVLAAMPRTFTTLITALKIHN